MAAGRLILQLKRYTMKRIDFLGIVPEQVTGKEIEADASVDLTDDEGARAFYTIVKNRLLHVDQWRKIAGMLSAEFRLTDASGHIITRVPEKGDYLKIDIPGPGSKEGDGYDWARIEDVRSVDEPDRQGIGFRVRPTYNPTGQKNEVAHFYDDAATSSFIVFREKNVVTAWIVDHNITPNTEPVSLIDKVRDSVVGLSALIKFSKIQWQKLADGLIKTVE